MRIHDGGILALCDRKLAGKVFREGSLVLDLKKHKDFYAGKRASEKEIESAMREASSMNIVGEKSVALAKKLGFIKGSEVIYIQKVPHVQIYRV